MTGKRDALLSDLARADARGVRPEDLADIPEAIDEEFARAVPHVGGVPAKRGRPRLAAPKEHVNLRLPPKVVEHFRRGGPGWLTRISEVLERHVTAQERKPED
ncbi:MAG TPA: BrnA antitoxin family protein [Afifellaceae bacterium]|nr:BrnA antitoxin family protein [Afifellaceae bacterium]